MALEGENELRDVHRTMQLWKTVIDDWRPGIWRPADIETRPEDRTFAAKLRNLGSAVTGG
ncbi:MAG TPA: hypothetical protein VKB55_19960 [Nocardioidaceae bacterium]|nr:hypothetical protein [Nocardioidaceae bacterium]